MASLRALQAYGKPVLLRLVDGPQPQHKLSAPAYALEALREVGLVKKRMVAKGALPKLTGFSLMKKARHRQSAATILISSTPCPRMER